MLFGYCKSCKHQNTTPGSDAFQREDYQQAHKQHVFTKKNMTNHDMPVNLWQESLLRRIKLVPLHLLFGRTTTSREMQFVSESTLVPLSSVWLRREGVGRNRLGALFGTPEQQHGTYEICTWLALLQNHLNSSPNSTYHLSILQPFSQHLALHLEIVVVLEAPVLQKKLQLEVREKYWLVVDLPLWKIWKSVGIIIPNIWKVIKFTCQTTNQNMYVVWLL